MGDGAEQVPGGGVRLRGRRRVSVNVRLDQLEREALRKAVGALKSAWVAAMFGTPYLKT